MENKRYAVDANAIKANIAKRRASEAQFEVWLSERKGETPALNWTLDTVKVLAEELGFPLEDVIDWIPEALGVLVKELGLLPQHVFDSQHILAAIGRKSTSCTN